MDLSIHLKYSRHICSLGTIRCVYGFNFPSPCCLLMFLNYRFFLKWFKCMGFFFFQLLLVDNNDPQWILGSITCGVFRKCKLSIYMFYRFQPLRTSVEYFVSNLCESYSSSSDRESRETLGAPYLLSCLAYGDSKQKYFNARSECLNGYSLLILWTLYLLYSYSRQKSHKAHFRKIADKSLKHN